MNKYTLYIGLNDKDTKRQQLDNLEASKIAVSYTHLTLPTMAVV